MTSTPDRWTLATTAAAALAVDPEGLGGLVLRARPGPVRDAFVALVLSLLARPAFRLPGTLEPSMLMPSLDLGETLRTGREVYAQDILTRAAGGVVLIPMAERLSPATSASIAAAMERPDAPVLIMIDESAEPDESPPASLSDLLAISLSLEGMALGDIGEDTFARADVAGAQGRLLRGLDDGDALMTFSKLSLSFGISSLRAPLLALRLARVFAGLHFSERVEEAHVSLAAALCLAPRATVMPSEEKPPDETPQQPEKPQEAPERAENATQGEMEDRVLDAIAAILPELALTAGRQRGGGTATGAGDRKRSPCHGRPVRSRPGKPVGRRLDVFSTLLTAAPWQPLRRQSAPDRSELIVLPQDFQVKQYERPSESVLIFLVDASGSQAAARMAEAKGAVELMLAEAYRRREKVALIAFRGTGAELLLPPTRSLLQAKRRLAILPGGGPTPLAAALLAGRELATKIRRRGATPYLVLLTDGRGNIGLSGDPGRAQAAEDASSAARAIAAEGFVSTLIDTANRPQKDATALAATMGAQYLPLPRADAKGISRLVRASLAA